jgi:delta24(24(1))-sterol reductase
MGDSVEHSPATMIIFFVVLFTAYYIWDTAQSQRNRFRTMRNGSYVPRKTFPQLPWGTLDINAKHILTKTGSTLLIDGWWAYARKIHYTADICMALLWGLICGFGSVIPYFYFCFFTGMIIHRAERDIHRCSRKYGDDWVKYCSIVPYLFIPYVY